MFCVVKFSCCWREGISNEGIERAGQGGSLFNHLYCELAHHQRPWLHAVELAMQPAIPLFYLYH